MALLSLRLCLTVILSTLLLITLVNSSMISTMSEGIISVPLWSQLGSLWVRAAREVFTSVHQVSHLVQDTGSPWIYLLAPLTLYIIYKLYQLLFQPLNRVRLLGDLGYIADGKMKMRDVAENVKRHRVVGDCPPVYPNGWFAVLESRDLEKGRATTVNCLGLHLAVFRGETGQSFVTDAYCPHMGANLGVGGIVKGNCLECPFHGWTFRGDDGKCVKIPYAEDKHIPDAAKVKSYIVLERNGYIFIWYHAEGVEPYWEPEEIPEIASGYWSYGGRTEHVVNSHIEEVPENGADVGHLFHLHSPFMTTGTDLRYTHSSFWDFLSHHWSADWRVEPNDPHIGKLTLAHKVNLFGYKIPVGLLNIDVEAFQIGPGIVHLILHTPFGKGAYIMSLTPVEPLIQRMVHHVYFPWAVPIFIHKFFMFSEAIQVERDIMVWNNKRYAGKPLFVKSEEDSLIARHRRWYSQFYSENSPRIQDLRQKSLEW